MNYRQPSEIKNEDGTPSGRWHYTVTNDGRTRADGYCSPWGECPKCKGICPPIFPSADACTTCDNRGLVKKAEPCRGHDMPEGAVEHYREYLLDTAHFDRSISDQQLKCEICGAWTQRMTATGPGLMDSHILCDEHCNRGGLAQVLRVGNSASSY